MHTITQLAPDDIPAAAEVIRQAFATVAEAGGARRGGGAAVRRRNDLHRGHVRKQETGALVRAAGLQHYGNPEVRAPPVRGVFHGEERVRAGRLGQGGARVGCGVRKIDQAFNLDD